MAFIAGAIIGTVGAIAGGAIAAKGAKSAAKTAAAGGDRSIEFQKESRDLARKDQAPYREAGYEALDALRSLTGLGGPQGASRNPIRSSINSGGRFSDANLGFQRRNRKFGSSYMFEDERATGGPMNGGTIYNINEEGPENIYQNGKVTRYPGPRTISGEGYVQPNVEGRATGGFMAAATGAMGNRMPRGGYNPEPMDVQPPPRPEYASPPTAPPNTANTTAVDPQTGYPKENPGGVEGGYQFQTDPGYQFRFEEGMRALDRGAAQRGGLLSGGYGRKAIRYGQGFASNEFGNVYNRISNIAGLGQVASGQSGQYAMYAGQGMGQAAQNSAYSQASGQQAAGNAWANAGNQIAQLPWGQVFNRNTGPFAGNPGTPNDF